MPSQHLDVGAAEVHVASTGSPKKAQAMGTLNAAKRNKLGKQQFADPANRAYPIQDKAHADNASARLEQQKGSMSSGKYRAIKSRIRAAQRRFGEKKTGASNGGVFHLRLSRPDGGHTIIHHQMSADGQPSVTACNAVYDESSKTLKLFFSLDKAQALSAADADGRVWIQVARTGAWAGHPAGAFRITEQTLDNWVDNFRSQNVGRLQYDFNHASAYPANSGSIPVTGTPAQGWFYDLQRRGDKLFALTEWLPLAKQYIEADQYGGVSPLINWAAIDRVSGRAIGSELRSIALTNLPFLTGMAPPTAASADGVPAQKQDLMPLTELTPEQAKQHQALGAYSYMSSGQMVGKLKQAFGLHELATAQHCSDALQNLCDHLDAVDGDATAKHEGVDLAGYVAKLRELVGDSEGMSSAELIQFIDRLLDEYMKENGIDDDDAGLSAETPAAESTEQPVATAASTEGTNMADPVVVPAAVVAPAETASPATEAPPTVAAAPAATVTAASAETQLPDPTVAKLTLELALLKAENEDLKASQTALAVPVVDNTEQALSAEVETAFATYRDAKKLTDELKPFMLSHLKAEPEAFRKMFPSVDPSQRHLLSNLTGGGASNPTQPGVRVQADTALDVAPPAPVVDENRRLLALGLNGLTDELISKSGGKLSLLAAQLDADQMLTAARVALNSAK